jgi:hypothetical protein
MNSPAKPTEAERTALEKHTARKGQRSPCPNLKFARHGPEVSIVMNHLDQETGFALVMQALGSTDPDFASGLITQLANASVRKGKMKEEVLNFMLAVIKSNGSSSHDDVGLHNATRKRRYNSAAR